MTLAHEEDYENTPPEKLHCKGRECTILRIGLGAIFSFTFPKLAFLGAMSQASNENEIVLPMVTGGFSTSWLSPGTILWLRTTIARSGAEDLLFRSIAQDAGLLAHWNLALRTVAANPGSTYAKTLGQQLTAAEARAAYNEVNKVFFELRGITGQGKWNVHHWNPIAKFPEYALDPRNLYLVTSAVVQGTTVGQHILLHWLSRFVNPWSGPLRPGAAVDLGAARSVIEALEAGRNF